MIVFAGYIGLYMISMLYVMYKPTVHSCRAKTNMKRQHLLTLQVNRYCVLALQCALWLIPSKHETSTQCWASVVPASQTMAQQCITIGSMWLSLVRWHGHHVVVFANTGDREGGIFHSWRVSLSQIWPHNHHVITMCVEQTIGTVYQNS